jgi:hypothetical protein
MAGVSSYTMRGARFGAIFVAIGMMVIVETLALHLLLMTRHPVGAWLLTVSSLSVLVWLVSDYRAMGDCALRVDTDTLEGRIGRRVALSVPRSQVAAAIRPEWRDVEGLGKGYLNATRPAAPNVLVSFREPTVVKVLGAGRRFEKLGLRLDDPEGFVAAMAVPSGTTVPNARS